jgi:hypothetical protein
MERLNHYRMKMVLVGIVSFVVLGYGGSAKADFIFGEPTLFDEPVNSAGVEYFDCISADGLEIYISKPVSGGITSRNKDLYVSTRENPNDPWSVPVNLGSTINGSDIDYAASLSGDGLELYFSGHRPFGNPYGHDIWVTKRDSKGADWGIPVNLGPPINTSSYDMLPWITPDGLELYFSSDRPGGYGVNDIWVATRATPNEEWGEPVNLGPPVNTAAGEYHPCLSPDGLVLFFSDYDNPSTRYRPGGHGESDMWMSRRKSTADPWEEPVNLGPGMNTSDYDSQPRISPDGSVLYFTSARSGKIGGFSDIWQSSVTPIVDLNADGIVDSVDMCIMVDHWGENYSLCDIGPTPLGDGVVDIQDMIVLAEHLFTYPGAVAYWKLDETEGNIAYDSIGDNDGTVSGEPTWQPEEGMVDGALQLDGIDDYISTEFIVNPAEGAFSIFVWIKGGAPGQVVLSQKDGVSWLFTDASEGNLMTELKGLGRSAAALLSQTVITDGNWHRIGLVWDGLQRTLYVDGVAVAEDIQDGMEGSDSGLYIGTGKAMESETFWSGLIDDVRIYSRAVIP